MALHKRPAAVLLDIMLPRLHIAEAFERHARLAFPPIVMVSRIAWRKRVRELLCLHNVCGQVINPWHTRPLISKVDQAPSHPQDRPGRRTG